MGRGFRFRRCGRMGGVRGFYDVWGNGEESETELATKFSNSPRYLHGQTGTIFSEPLFSLPVVRHHLIYFVPKEIAMITVVKMA